MYQNKKFLILPLLTTIVVFLSACSSTEGGGDRTSMCKERYTNAEKDFKDGKYGKVKEPLEEILSLCVGTGYMEQTQFLLAESYFNLDEWLEARGEYGSFVLNFPSSPFIETAEFRKAVSSFNMEFNIARDETNTTLAMKDFDRFASNYPNSPLLDSVAFYQGQLVERRAEKDYMTARLYFRMDEPQAAVIYLKEFLTLYPKSKRLPEVLFLLVESYTALDQFDPARNYLKIAQETIPTSFEDRDKTIKDLEKNIAQAEETFTKKLENEKQQKLVKKEEAEEAK
jgi:outer membrane protein assembly factor BamD